jgi:hypothetical protein
MRQVSQNAAEIAIEIAGRRDIGGKIEGLMGCSRNFDHGCGA